MGRVFRVDNQYINEKILENEVQKILDVLRKEKRTYSMNIFILKNVIKVLQDEVKEIANTKVFQ